MSVESAITEGVAKSFTRSAARAAARNATRKGVAGEVRQSALMNGFKAGLTATNAAARNSLLQLYARSNINQILTKQGLKAAFKEYLKTELEAKLIDASTSLGANLYNLLSGKGKDKGVLKTMTEGLTKSASDRLRKQNTINGKIDQENNRKLNNNKTSIKNSLNKVSSVSRELNNIDTEALLKLENTRKKNLLTYRNDLNKLEKNEEKTTLRLDKLKNSLVKASGTLGVVSLLDLIILHLERNEELKGVSVLNKTTNTKLKIAEIKSKLNLASESSHILKNVDDKVALSKSRLKNTTIRSVGKLKKHRKFKMPDFSLFHMYKRYIKLQAAMGLMNLLGQQVDGYNPEDGDLADMGESLASKLDQMGDQGGAKKWINDLSDNVTDWITDRLMDASEYLPDSVKNSDWYDNWVTQKIVPFIASVPNGIIRFGSLVIPETAKNETIVGGVRSGFGYFERFFIFPWILNDYFGIDLSLNNNISLTDLIYNALSSNGPAKLIAKGYRFINDLRGKDTSNEYKFQSEYGLGLSDYEYNAIKNLGNIEAIYQNQNYGVDALADQSTDYAIKINPDALYTSGFSALTLQTPMTDIKVAGNYYKHYLNGEKYKGDNSEPDFSGTFNLGKASGWTYKPYQKLTNLIGNGSVAQYEANSNKQMAIACLVKDDDRSLREALEAYKLPIMQKYIHYNNSEVTKLIMNTVGIAYSDYDPDNCSKLDYDIMDTPEETEYKQAILKAEGMLDKFDLNYGDYTTPEFKKAYEDAYNTLVDLKHRWRARWEEYDKELDKDIADLLEKQKKDTIKKSDEFKNTHGYIPSTVNSKTNEPSFVMKPDPVKAVSNVTYNLPSYQPNVSVSKPVENSKLNDIESKVESKTKEVVSKTLNNNRGVVKLVKTMNIYEDK